MLWPGLGAPRGVWVLCRVLEMTLAGEQSVERALLEWLAATATEHGNLDVHIGDDGAVWNLEEATRLVLVADTIVESVHFEPGAQPELVGRKALAVNLSDLAAMGAHPLCAVATCVAPRGMALETGQRMTLGMRQLGAEFNCPLVGGDFTSHGGALSLSVTALGTLSGRRPVLRSGAEPGDAIFVTGFLGRGWQTDHHLTFTPRLLESTELVARGIPKAMMDISDGLLLDLHRIADASGTGFVIDGDLLPLRSGATIKEALQDGEDYELLFTCASDRATELLESWRGSTPLSRVGTILEQDRIMRTELGEHPAPRAGYEHA